MSCKTPTLLVRARTPSIASPGFPDEVRPEFPLPLAPLGGVPLAVKDLFCTEGIPSQSGSRILEGYLPPYKATVVARLRAGAPLPGKCNMDEFAMGSSTENSAFFPARNPWDRKRTPGGSSGGSAAAVAAGLRRARSAPTRAGHPPAGRAHRRGGAQADLRAVSRYGLIAFASSLDQVGPFARRGAPPGAPRSSPAATGATPPRRRARYEEACRRDASTMSAWACPRSTGDGIDPGVLAPSRRLARPRGSARYRPGPPPALPHAVAAYYILATPRRRRTWPASTACASACASTPTDLVGSTRDPQRRLRPRGQAAHHARHLRPLRRLLRGLLPARPAGAHHREDFRAVFERGDFVVAPTRPIVAFELGAKTGDPLSMYLNDFCTVPMSLAGIPAISIPCGLSGASQGLGPGGIGLAGRLSACRPRFQ